MSVPPPPPPQRRNGCLTAVMILAGIVLLLPGLCAFGLVVDDPKLMSRYQTGLLMCMASVAGGIALIWFAIRRPR